MAVLSGVLALVSIGLATAGIHGVACFVIGRRAREIAVRIALGATRQDLARQLVRETLKPVVAGLVGGLLAVVLFSHVLSSVLYGISARDPLSFFGGTVLLLGAALLAVAPAVWRAARLSPAEVLKVS
jgi:putative ABC transport system permease protein